MPLAKLSIDIEARLANFERDLGKLSSATDNFARQSGRSFDAVNASMARMGDLARQALVGFGVTQFVGKLVSVQREFDVLNSALVTIAGGAEKAQKEMVWIERFAAETPFSLAEVTQAFIRMKSLGLDASEEALRSYGNTASAMGKTLEQFIEAVADASTGEFERLKEFGIKASKSGNEVAFTFQGVTTRIKNGADEISAYLAKIGDVNFAGAMAERAKTLDGALSNLGDTWDKLFRTINSQNAGSIIHDSVRAATGAISDAIDIISAMNDATRQGADESAAFAAAQGGLRTVFEAVAVTGVNVKYVLAAIGTELGGMAAQLAALARGDFKAFGTIGQLMKADAEAARKEVDAMSARILNARQIASDKSGFAALSDGLDGSGKNKPKPSAATGAGSGKQDEAAKLLATLNQKIAVQSAELAGTEKTTAAEKEAVEIMVKLRDGTLQATDAQKRMLASRLESLIVGDKEVASHQAYLKALDDQAEANRKARTEMEAAIRNARESAETYGLSEVQLSALAEARLTDAIAIARQNGAGAEQIAYLEEELALRRRLTSAIDDLDVKRTLAGTPTGQASAQHARIEELRRQMNDGKISETDYDEAVNALVGKTVDALTTMDEFAKSAAHNMQSALADFFINPSKDGIKGLASSFTATMQRMIAEAGSAQLMKNIFGNMGQASNGQAASWGWLGQAASWVGSFFADGGVMTNRGPLPLRKYAGGGIARSPQLAMFGEGSTPEAYVPLPDGRAIPVKVSGQSGTTINQTIYAGQGTDSAQVRRSAAAGARAALGAMSGAQRYA